MRSLSIAAAVLDLQDQRGKCDPRGCSPGYWKNHESSWSANGYETTDGFDTVIGVDCLHPNLTLLQALNPTAVPNPNLPTHAVAALASGSLSQITALKNSLDSANDAGCPF